MTGCITRGIAAISAGVVLMLTACGDDDDGPLTAREVLDASAEAMASESFVYVPPYSNDGSLVQYAPPDRVMFSGAGGHDSWPYYLVIGEELYTSNGGKRWLSGAEIDAIGVSFRLGDPRFLMEIAADVRLGSSGRENEYVIHGSIDMEDFLKRLLGGTDPDSEEGADIREYAELIASDLTFEMVIGKDDLRIVKMKTTRSDTESADRVVFDMVFDYTDTVDIPEEPNAMPAEEANRIRFSVDAAASVVSGAIRDYRSDHGVYPDSLTRSVLEEYLEQGDGFVDRLGGRAELDEDGWPINPFNGEPMKQTDTDSPGDFFYLAKNDGRDYEFTVFGWDGAISQTDTAR